MNAKFKKFLFALVTVVLGAMSSGAMATPTPPTFTATVNGTSYNLTYFTGSYSDNISKFNTTLMPWWGNISDATNFSNAVGKGFGSPNNVGIGYASGPLFTHSHSGGYINNIWYATAYNGSFTYNVLDTASYSFATLAVNPGAAAVPEIDGALIPQVGLLIAGLFLILGRKNQNPEPMLARLSEC